VESLSLWFEKLIFGESGPVADGPAVITLVGSGGKTSLIWLLARRLSQSRSLRKVLVTPAAKMLLPSRNGCFFDWCYNGAPPAPARGISLSGTFNEKTGKLESLPLPELEGIIGGYDVVLIEGDGSKELPLKGWAAHEPVVPSFTGITVGMLPLWPLGKPVSGKIVHRLPLFRALTGAKPGEALSLDHLAALISGSQKNGAHSAARSLRGFSPNDKENAQFCAFSTLQTPKGAQNPGVFAVKGRKNPQVPQAPRSLFSAARGKKILFINQIEDEADFSPARNLVSLLLPEFRSGLHRIIAGSVRQDTVQELKLSCPIEDALNSV
jgi:probable selenium-dependent hydroxylase accessory protein YqeC